jgi:transcriptional regulator with XRE-family HTH domain
MRQARAPLQLVTNEQSTIHLGNVFRSCRTRAELTQEQAANRAGITRNALAALEKKALPNPSLKTLLSLMRAYDLDSIEVLLGPVPSRLLAAAWLAQGDSAD